MIRLTATEFVMQGDLGIPEHHLDAFQRAELEQRLTRVKKPWDETDKPERVCCLRRDGGYLWVPRYYEPALWPGVNRWEWSEGEPYTFEVKVKLDPERGQPPAVPAMIEHVRLHGGGMLIAPTGTGKCLGLGTPVLMADGQVKPVEQIVAGDRLMGPDGKARTVLSTTAGRGPLYRVTPIKGESWVCNDVHVLTLVNTTTNTVVDIGLDAWCKETKKFRHLHKLFSVGVERFEREPAAPTVDPYFLGVWFGDGSKTVRDFAAGPGLPTVKISKPDPEIRALCEKTAHVWGLKCRAFDLDRCPTYALVTDETAIGRDEHGHFTRTNPLLVAMRVLVGTKIRVPDAIFRGSRATRLAFLAGFLDADAELTCNCFVLTQKREDWARAAWWIARSLGLCATITTRTAKDQHGTEGTYHVVTISGDVDEIPTRIPRRQAVPRKQRKNATRTGFGVTHLGDGDYYGFTLDGDGRFLLGDFTVTHNTTMACAVAAAFGRKIGVPIYVSHMYDNWVEHAKLVLGLKDEDIGVFKADQCDFGKPITLISVQTLLARGLPAQLKQQIGFLVCDEVHRYGAKVWREIVSQFPAKYRLGLTAKIERKDKLEDVVRWSFGSVGYTAKRVRTETVKPPRVVMIGFNSAYDPKKYCKWKKDADTGEWFMGRPDTGKYDKLVAADRDRTQRLADEIGNAGRTGRQVLVLSSLVGHLENLRVDTFKAVDPIHPLQRIINNIPYPAEHEFVRTAALEAGLSPEERADVGQSDVIFATYQMGRDALNIPKLDTLVMATQPGDLTQPMGRLREKSEGYDRRELLIIYTYETGNTFSVDRARRHRQEFERAGCKVDVIARAVR